MRKTIALVALLTFTVSSITPAVSAEKLGNPFDVKVAAAKKVAFGVAQDMSANLTIKKVKKKLVSTYYPINVTVSDFKVNDVTTDWRGDAIGYIPRYSYTLTVKNFNKKEEVVGVYSQLWCKNSGNYAENWSQGFSAYQTLPPLTESSGTTIVSLPQDVTSLAACEQPLIYLFPNYSFTLAQSKKAKFPTSLVVPIDPTLVQ